MRFFPHFGRAALAFALTLSICGCGQKGPLYLRDKPPAGVKPECGQWHEDVANACEMLDPNIHREILAP